MAHYLETLESVAVSFSASGDNEVVAAPGAGKYLAIDFLQFVPAGDTSITLYDGSTALTGAMPFKANQPDTVENAMENEHGVITCSDNSAFKINSSAAVLVAGFCRYRIINK